MNKVEFKNMVVHNVEQCPQCAKNMYTYCNYMNILTIVCGGCGLDAGRGVKINGKILDGEGDDFKNVIRILFNCWNETAANINDEKVRKVVIRKKVKK